MGNKKCVTMKQEELKQIFVSKSSHEWMCAKIFEPEEVDGVEYTSMILRQYVMRIFFFFTNIL